MKNSAERNYRVLAARPGLVRFRVMARESDLHIQAASDLSALATELLLGCRARLEAYIADHPLFAETLSPYPVSGPAPGIVREMAAAGEAAGVGPMAAVAGAVAQHVGRELARSSAEVVVENGGDVFVKLDGPFTTAIYAGESPLSLRVGLRIDGRGGPISICTSSGTVGHSKSFGRADAAVVVARDCALADALATALGNRIREPASIKAALSWLEKIPQVIGGAAVMGKLFGAFGDLAVVNLPPA
ncbi:MAG: UPF0280 family protein [Thermodesulfobacteriota bacterium]